MPSQPAVSMAARNWSLPKLTTIIVNWNAHDYLHDCLVSLREAISQDLCRVIVVDNGSTDGSLDMIRSFRPCVDLIQLPKNLGFAGANNLGLAQSTTPFVLLLNSDTVVSTGVLSAMLSTMESNPNLQVLGCAQRDGSGSPIGGFGRFPSLISEFLVMTGTFKWWFVRKIIELRRRRLISSASTSIPDAKDSLETSSIPDIAPVDWVNGACMMLRRQTISSMGGLDEGYFFYSEDTDLCMRVNRAGGVVGFASSLTITHYCGGSSRKDYLRLLKQYMVGRLRFFRKHYGRTKATALLGIYTVAGFMSVAKWIVFLAIPSRRSMALQWIRFWIGILPAANGFRQRLAANI